MKPLFFHFDDDGTFETEEEMINRINYLEKEDDDLVDHIKTLEIE